MCAWTGFPATQTTDWSNVSFFKQFWEAYKERQDNVPGFGSASVYVPAVGCDVQYMGTNAPASTTGSFSVYVLQYQIESWCHLFVATIDSGGNPITDFDNTANGVEMWTWAKIVSRVLGGNGWTRKYPDGMGGTTTAYGKCQPGDFFGEWIWNELQAVFNVLVWSRGWTSEHYDNPYPRIAWSGEYWVGYSYGATWEAAKTAAIAAWAYDSDSSGQPFARCGFLDSPPTQYYARLERNIFCLGFSITTTCSFEADFYAKSSAFSGETYDAQGDGVVEDTWMLFDTQSSGPGASTVVSAVLGNTTPPPNWPSAPLDSSWVTLSWLVDNFMESVVIRWNVSGGFTYC